MKRKMGVMGDKKVEYFEREVDGEYSFIDGEWVFVEKSTDIR